MKIKVLMAAGIIVASSAAYAGTWHTGKGATATEAMNMALMLAEYAVKKRGKGCVDTDRIEIEEPSSGKWIAKVHRSHHDGSCDIDRVKKEISKRTGIPL